MEIPLSSALYVPRSTISPSSGFATYFSKLGSLMKLLFWSLCQQDFF